MTFAESRKYEQQSQKDEAQAPMNFGDELRAAMGSSSKAGVAAFLEFHKKDLLAKAARGDTYAFFEIAADTTDEADKNILDYDEETLKNILALHGLYLTDFYESEQGRLSFTLNWN